MATVLQTRLRRRSRKPALGSLWATMTFLAKPAARPGPEAGGLAAGCAA
ncbi:MAG TPA: hypothetical protein VGP44_06965 [Gemmatimonadales bacterium]|nr:hypothetical protein [Gemmatimonadales bacterium]